MTPKGKKLFPPLGWDSRTEWTVLADGTIIINHPEHNPMRMVDGAWYPLPSPQETVDDLNPYGNAT
jgi:hypothetical protein